MAILKIARMGNPTLAAPAQPVDDPTAPEILELVKNMVETMDDADGTGLAAPQVHVPLRVVVFFVSPGRDAYDVEDGEDEGVSLTVLINPEIEVLSDETEVGWEGCLSLPGMIGEVERPLHIRYQGLGLDGGLIEREAHGFHARVVQHECDHLDGILYPQRISDLSRFGFTDEMRRSTVRVSQSEEDEDDDEEDNG